MTDTYICTGADPIEARRVLFAAVEEMHRRDHIVTEARAESWDGPDLYLTIEAVDQLNQDGRTALRHLLQWGRKLGVTGVVRGPVVAGVPAGVDPIIRDLLSAGTPLRWEPSDAHTHELIAAS